MPASTSELPDNLYAEIRKYCAEGDKLAAQNEFSSAIKTYNQGWHLIPEPKTDWNASTWILGAIADAAYLGGFRETARDALDYVMRCPGAIGNPFLHLRYGQVLLDAGETKHAADELTRAFMGAGEEIFLQDDPKYLAFVRTQLMES